MCAVMEKHIGAVECFCRDKKMTGFAALDPVSYTHLDVYKRQAFFDVSSPVIARWRSEREGTEETHDTIIGFLRPFLLTAPLGNHLGTHIEEDVYKRQLRLLLYGFVELTKLSPPIVYAPLAFS